MNGLSSAFGLNCPTTASDALVATIDNMAANPATATVNVTFPVNAVVQVNAWTR